jgi:streptogramin lyase
MSRHWLQISLMLTIGALFFSTTASAVTFGTGDIFASTGGGTVQVYDPTGVLLDTLNTGLGGFTTGSVTNVNTGNFYVTDFSAANVSEFSNTGALIGTFGSGYTATANPESILFDGSGNVWVGQASAPADPHNVLEFNGAGAPINSFAVASQDRGSDWIDLGADQHTLYYTSEGNTILTYNTSTHTQGADIGTMTGAAAYAIRLLGDGTALVADSATVDRIDLTTGAIVQTYVIPGSSGNLFALNLDPNGTDFWTGDSGNGDLWRVNIASGIVEQTIATGAAGNLFGVSVYGEITQSSTPEPGQLGTSLALIGLLAFLGYRRSKLNAKAAEKA